MDFRGKISGLQEGLDTSSENAMFMVRIEEVIEPFIPSIKRGTPVESILPAVLGKAHQEGLTSIDEDEVRTLLDSYITPIVTAIKAEIPSQKARPTINLNRYREGMTLRQLERQGELLKRIREIVDKKGDGVKKTAILQHLRKDNSYWRPKITLYLLHLCNDGVIQSDNGREPCYYPYDAYVKNREREVHRRVVEALQIHGQMTMTQIAIQIGRNGGSNRKQVSFALEDLKREGFVRLGQRSRWAWIT